MILFLGLEHFQCIWDEETWHETWNFHLLLSHPTTSFLPLRTLCLRLLRELRHPKRTPHTCDACVYPHHTHHGHTKATKTREEIFLEPPSQLFTLRAADGIPTATPVTELTLLASSFSRSAPQILPFPISPGILELPIPAGNGQGSSACPLNCCGPGNGDFHPLPQRNASDCLSLAKSLPMVKAWP